MSDIRILGSGSRWATPQDHASIIHNGLVAGISVLLMMGRATSPLGVTLVHGGYRASPEDPYSGADGIMDAYARSAGWAVEAHPAMRHPTQDFGRWPGAGPARNRYMVALGADAFIGFPLTGSRGTWRCEEAARGQIPVMLTFDLELIR